MDHALIFRLMPGLQEEKEEKEVTKLVDGVVPRVDFVRAGAVGEDDWKVKKTRGGKMAGSFNPQDFAMAADGKGGFSFVQKSATPDDEEITLEPTTKAALDAKIVSLRGHLDALELITKAAKEDPKADKAAIPPKVQKLLAQIAKELGVAKSEPDPKPEDAPKPAAEGAAPESKKGADDTPAAAAGEDGTFTLGELFLSGALAAQAATLKKSFPGLSDKDFVATYEPMFTPLAEAAVQAEPAAAAAAMMASVNKSRDAEMAEIKKSLTALQEQNAALAGGQFFTPPGVIPDGDHQEGIKPTQKAKRTAPMLSLSEDIGAEIASMGEGVNYKFTD